MLVKRSIKRLSCPLVMMTIIRNTLLLTLIFPAALAAECPPEAAQNCCVKDSDCAAFFHPSYCAVVSLNKEEIKKLNQQKLKHADFCGADIVDKLRADIPYKRPICLKSRCEFQEDNG